MRSWTIGGIAMLGLAMAGCSSSTEFVIPNPSTSASSPTTVAVNLERARLEFREVKGTASCNSKRVTPPSRVTAGAGVVLADRAKSLCYDLGPTLLTGKNIGRVQAVVEHATGAWVVDIHFTNDDFVTKVARPYIDQQIAIVLDGVVQSAPRINSGITGQDVTISGTFDEATARDIARRLS